MSGFPKGWITLSANFRGKRGVVHQRLLASEELKSLDYRVALFAWSYVQPFWYNTGVWQTDTHRHTMMDNTRASLSPCGQQQWKDLLHCIADDGTRHDYLFCKPTCTYYVYLTLLNTCLIFFHATSRGSVYVCQDTKSRSY